MITSDGDGFDVREWPAHVTEEQVPHSTALHSRLDGAAGYLVGPMARYSLNSAQLCALARQAAVEAGLGPDCRNPFRSIVVRAVEILHACDEALRILVGYTEPDVPFVPVAPRAATGHGASEAPRGTLYHRYRIDADGLICEADIAIALGRAPGRLPAELVVLGIEGGDFAIGAPMTPPGPSRSPPHGRRLAGKARTGRYLSRRAPYPVGAFPSSTTGAESGIPVMLVPVNGALVQGNLRNTARSRCDRPGSIRGCRKRQGTSAQRAWIAVSARPSACRGDALVSISTASGQLAIVAAVVVALAWSASEIPPVRLARRAEVLVARRCSERRRGRCGASPHVHCRHTQARLAGLRLRRTPGGRAAHISTAGCGTFDSGRPDGQGYEMERRG
ncbi:hypothetical protein [Microbispora sp. NPDC049125]|uniref:hypothetical protein n=1 Tax=Microbispora sp. NPDC049125 TaxID=3154929 RepID=UPI00346570FB